jgi:membrane-bound lytic murein transglycosylase B
VPKGLWAAFRAVPRLWKRLWRVVRRSGGRIAAQAALTLAVIAGALGLAVYVVPNAGPDWAYGEEHTEPTPASEEDDGPLAIPPGLEAVPGLSDASVPDDADAPGDQESGSTGPEKDKALSDWAGSLSAVDIPTRALEAYGSAEIALAQVKPGCHLTWTTLAGIGSVETNHGSTGGTALGTDGKPKEPIRGPALDGSAGNKAIKDTDDGSYDGDTEWDRAVGPMQFIPTTWERWQADGDGDGTSDPNDIDDVAVAAGYYLCADGRDLSRAVDWYAAIYSYNHLDSYVRDVYDRADAYGKASKTA